LPTSLRPAFFLSTPLSFLSPFSFQCYCDHPDLHSFPTRRSSDLHRPRSTERDRMTRRPKQPDSIEPEGLSRRDFILAAVIAGGSGALLLDLPGFGRGELPADAGHLTFDRRRTRPGHTVRLDVRDVNGLDGDASLVLLRSDEALG